MNYENEIADLMMNNGKSAAQITHALKVLGGGEDMQKGLAVIGRYFQEKNVLTAIENLRLGRIQGAAAAGIASFLIYSCIDHFRQEHRKYAQQKAELEKMRQEILNAMEDVTVSQDEQTLVLK